MPFVNTTNGKIYITDKKCQKPVYPPLVLVHGAGGSRLDWHPSLRRFPDARIITVDLPGHGKSPPPGRTTTEAYARDVLAVLHALALPPAIIVGHSMGGAIAQQLALIAPDSVAGLVLIATGSKLPVDPQLPQRILSEPDQTLDWITAWAWHPDVPESVKQRSKERMQQTPREILQGDYVACQGFDTRKRVHEIAAPALIIGSNSDRMVKVKFSIALAERIPNATLLLLGDTGHMIPLERPETVTQAIANWLAEQTWQTY